MYFGFQNITIEYGKKRIVSDINVSFPKGKITTIIGRNGCGKSSLLKVVSGAVKPVTGRALFEDKPLRKYNSRVLARKIAYLPQVFFSPPDIDVYTMVSYGRYPYSKFGRGLTKEDSDVIEKS
jgi:iron complex transport system ATP-binding protein